MSRRCDDTPLGFTRKAGAAMTEANQSQQGAAEHEGETGDAKLTGHDRNESCCGNHDHSGHEHAEADHHAHDAHGSMVEAHGHVKDPVCGMDVDPHSTKHKAEHQGKTYYFCSAGCRERFEAEPTKYIAPAPAKTEQVPAGAIYTCPMHPEIRQAGPGHCPICGMALEPVLATAESGPDPEQ